MKNKLAEIKRLFPESVIDTSGCCNGTELEYLIEDDEGHDVLVIITPDRSELHREAVAKLSGFGLSGTWRTTHEKKK